MLESSHPMFFGGTNFVSFSTTKIGKYLKISFFLENFPKFLVSQNEVLTFENHWLYYRGRVGYRVIYLFIYFS